MSALQIYGMTGWLYWLLGAVHCLTLRDGAPARVQSITLTLQRFSGAFLEFNFSYLLQCRLALLENGVGKVRVIRWLVLMLAVSLKALREYVPTTSQLTDWSSATYHLVAGLGVSWLPTSRLEPL